MHNGQFWDWCDSAIFPFVLCNIGERLVKCRANVPEEYEHDTAVMHITNATAYMLARSSSLWPLIKWWFRIDVVHGRNMFMLSADEQMRARKENKHFYPSAQIPTYIYESFGIEMFTAGLVWMSDFRTITYFSLFIRMSCKWLLWNGVNHSHWQQVSWRGPWDVDISNAKIQFLITVMS